MASRCASCPPRPRRTKRSRPIRTASFSPTARAIRRCITYAHKTVRSLIGKKPIFGICLGHQILGYALGGKTFKLKFGHRGGNQPVKDLTTGRISITSQNHGFAVDPKSLPAAEVETTQINLNDQTSEGLRHRSEPVFSVQYHPEAAPGPHDANYFFREFGKMIEKRLQKFVAFAIMPRLVAQSPEFAGKIIRSRRPGNHGGPRRGQQDPGRARQRFGPSRGAQARRPGLRHQGPRLDQRHAHQRRAHHAAEASPQRHPAPGQHRVALRFRAPAARASRCRSPSERVNLAECASHGRPA